jgi:transposase-like protein
MAALRIRNYPAVRSLRYALSYRDLEEMMSKRGLTVVHTTIYRWEQAYAPDID